MFFPPDQERTTGRRQREKVAKAICMHCPVIVQCLTHALTVGEQFGVWGGMSAPERESLTAAGGGIGNGKVPPRPPSDDRTTVRVGGFTDIYRSVRGEPRR